MEFKTLKFILIAITEFALCIIYFFYYFGVIFLPKQQFFISFLSSSFLTGNGDFDIDVVFTWVNGSDPIWQEKYFEVAPEYGIKMNNLTFNSRFVNIDELKYAIRSVEKNIPWVRRIFIVTAGQIPTWLNESYLLKSSDYDQKSHSYYSQNSPKLSFTSNNINSKHNITIQIVDHAEIFPDDFKLPSYNSNSIEFCMTNIPGLSEHFIYMNDDMFIGQPLTKSFFFHESGKPIFPIRSSTWIFPNLLYKYYMSLKERNDMAYYQHRVVLYGSVSLCEKFFNKIQFGKYSHGPIPLTKTIVQDVYKIFPKQSNITVRSRFRHYTDILLQQVSILLSLGMDKAYYYSIPMTIYFKFNSPSVVKDLFHMAKKGTLPPIFCLNNVKEYAPAIKQFFEIFMPVPSLFEKI